MKLKNYVIAVVATTLVACGESEIETPSLPLDEEKPTELGSADFPSGRLGRVGIKL